MLNKKEIYFYKERNVLYKCELNAINIRWTSEEKSIRIEKNETNKKI